MNEFKVEILPDGRVVVESAAWGSKDHQSAEQFFRDLPKLLGAESVKVSRVSASHKHKHEHGHHHTHKH